MTDPFDAAAHGAAALGAGHSQHTEWFWVELAITRERWRPARHPFFGALARAELTAPDLAVYAGEHDHIVVALADAARQAALLAGGLLADTLDEHAEGRELQIAVWRDFARGLGWCAGGAMYYGADPYEGTTTCAQLVAAADLDVAGHLVALHSLACAERDVWAIIRRALGDHHGRTDDPTADRRAAVRDANVDRLQAALEGLLFQSDPFVLLRRGEAVTRSYWHMLDDIDAHRDRRSGELT